jgi:hypothetical protein
MEAEKTVPRAIKRIKKARVNNGQTEYFVKFEGGDSGAWLPASRIDPALINAFQARHSAKAPPSTGPGGPAQALKEICGIIPHEDSWSFVVRFANSAKDEMLSRAEMRARYPRQLAKFYEAHLEHGAAIGAVP